MELLCKGHRPPTELVVNWFTDTDSEGLQNFAAEHGPEWAQGVGVIDAARLLADTPTEILCLNGPQQDHEAFPF